MLYTIPGSLCQEIQDPCVRFASLMEAHGSLALAGGVSSLQLLVHFAVIGSFWSERVVMVSESVTSSTHLVMMYAPPSWRSHPRLNEIFIAQDLGNGLYGETEIGGEMKPRFISEAENTRLVNLICN